MKEKKQAWWMTGVAIVILLVASYEVMAGFILAYAVILGMALYKNSQRQVKLAKKALIYGILGAILVVLDWAALHDITGVGYGNSTLELLMIGTSGILVGLVVRWESKRPSSL